MELALLDFEEYKKEAPTHRDGEKEGTYFRSDRFLKVNNSFYFATREGVEIGPFKSKSEAELGLDRFIHCIQKEQNFDRARLVALSNSWAFMNFR